VCLVTWCELLVEGHKWFEYGCCDYKLVPHIRNLAYYADILYAFRLKPDQPLPVAMAW